MKKILLLIVAPFVFFSALFADTVSQEEADRIVLERLNKETQSYTVYAKEGVQKEMRIITSTGELLEINYFCWVYYVRYAADTNQGRYLIVKEANGSLLEVDAKIGAGPEDLEKWREVMMEGDSNVDANVLILGKWELVLLDGGPGKERKYEPTGYVEYLPNGHFGWYDYETKEYTLYEGKYWLDKTHNEFPLPERFKDYWVLHYDNPRIFYEDVGMFGYKYQQYQDRPPKNNFLLKFIDQNTKSLFCLDLIPAFPHPDFIYKRK